MRRVLLAIAGVSLAAVLVAAVAVTVLRTVIAHKDEVIARDVAILIGVGELIATESQEARKTRAYLLTGDERFLGERDHLRQQLSARVERLGQTPLTADQRTRLEQVVQLEGRIREIVDKLIARRRAGEDPVAIAARFETELQPLRDQLDLALEDLQEGAERQLAEARRQSEALAERSFAVLALTSAASLALIAALCLVLARTSHRLLRAAAFGERVLAIVSHDVRSPLAAILASASHSRRRPGASEAEQSNADRIIRSARRIEGLAKLLLDFSRARMRGGLPVVPAPDDLHAAVRAIVEELREAFPERGIEHQEEGDGRGEFDRARLGQAVANLIDNAIRHGAPDRPVRVTSSGTSSESVEVVVHNEGALIDPALLPFIFDPFHKGATRPPLRESHGLGLYVVNEVAKGHGGRVEVASTAHGTTFRIQLPRVRRGPTATPTS